MSSSTLSCRACREAMPAAARYCPSCGAASSRHRKELARRDQARGRRQRRAGAALAWLACGTLLGGLGFDGWLESSWALLAAHAIWMLAAALIGAALMGWAPVRAWLPLGWRADGWWKAPLIGVGGFLFAWGYVALISSILDAGVEPAEVSGVEIAAALLIAPVLEELLCRGVAWEAARRLGGPRAAWTISSVVFAGIHALNGGFWLEMPHRLVGGFALGWLRAGSGGLWAPVLAHFCWNALAVLP